MLGFQQDWTILATVNILHRYTALFTQIQISIDTVSQLHDCSNKPIHELINAMYFLFCHTIIFYDIVYVQICKRSVNFSDLASVQICKFQINTFHTLIEFHICLQREDITKIGIINCIS